MGGWFGAREQGTAWLHYPGFGWWGWVSDVPLEEMGCGGGLRSPLGGKWLPQTPAGATQESLGHEPLATFS